MPRARLTLVTSLFDLASREPGVERRTVADYLSRAAWLMGLEQNLVVFADPVLAGEIARRRADAGNGARTHVIPRRFEDTAAHECVGQIAAVRARRPLRNGNPQKDTPLYTAQTWTKLELAGEASERDAFGTTHLAWIDFGIESRPSPEDDVFGIAPAGPRLVQLRPFNASDLAPVADYLDAIHGLVASSYVLAPTQKWSELADRFAGLARGVLADGLTGSEEQLLPLLMTDPGLEFEVRYADYGDVLMNFERPHGSGQNLLFQMRWARDRGRAEAGHDIGAWLVPAVEAGTFECDGRTLAALLDECFVAAYHARAPDLEPARRAARLCTELIHSDHEARDWFLDDEIRIRKNLELLDDAALQP